VTSQTTRTDTASKRSSIPVNVTQSQGRQLVYTSACLARPAQPYCARPVSETVATQIEPQSAVQKRRLTKPSWLQCMRSVSRMCSWRLDAMRRSALDSSTTPYTIAPAGSWGAVTAAGPGKPLPGLAGSSTGMSARCNHRCPYCWQRRAWDCGWPRHHGQPLWR
jgi:sulfatase maturation enzyme AslB (radical SAM superfamily)